ncbi:MAG: hypothetical protein LBF09_03790 [Odoribacteraceae bacterium]|jgi:hypothetical protein|nr:hypothetical protein [Odoribacteraceae bacterium]
MKHVLLLALLAASCSVVPPRDAREVTLPVILSPDYTGITIPYNIAPLNFEILLDADDYITVARGDRSGSVAVRGRVVRFPLKAWRRLLDENKGASILLEIYLKRDGEWVRLPRVRDHVSEFPVDRYLSYRLIEPGYVYYWDLAIRQRDLSSFEEHDIFNNRESPRDRSRLCVNCHAFQSYRGDKMQLHGRGKDGGTVIVRDGKATKVDLKTGDLVSGGVYPAWHPTEDLIAYSVSRTGQLFHSRDVRKVEVQDLVSDLILYDVDANTVAYVARDTNELETFPAWSPDGKFLYYSSAVYRPTLANRSLNAMVSYKDIRYNILRRPFDAATRRFGDPEMVFDAAADGKSATLPRVSPDGRFLLFALGDFGIFHVWHPESDLYLLDLSTGDHGPLAAANSAAAESYHSWSSNGRWIVFSSRRADGSFSHPYLSFFNDQGQASKPFIVPQHSPSLYSRLYKSFNIPELTTTPHTNTHQIEKAFSTTPTTPRFRHAR